MTFRVIGDISGAPEPPFVLRREDYDSPLEHRFAHQAVKYFWPGLDLRKQVPVATPTGRFRLDFLVTSLFGRCIAFECDGVAYHSSDDQRERDLRRDRAVLESGGIDAIYRLRGKDLWFRPEDCFFALAHWERSLFSERALINLFRAASPEIRDLDGSAWGNHVAFRYTREQGGEDHPSTADFHVERRTI